MRIYKGHNTGIDGQSVEIFNAFTGERIGPLQQRIIRHSPDGFQWGYGGSGPSDLALNLLLDVAERYLPGMGREFTDRHYMSFKHDFITKQESDLRIEEFAVLAWIDKIREEEKGE